jgi:menaquinone-dependent protoporphyrinogen IX oxidase|tara:strand:+ start:4546 stop:4812 length:267 start_codon:yes stop_codon:yes gene_type:complete
MQVTNSATIVDYFPEAFIAEADDTKGMKVTVKRFVKRVTFRANGMKSYSTVLGIEAKYDWNQRIANGAKVTGFNTDKMPSSEYMPLYC